LLSAAATAPALGLVNKQQQQGEQETMIQLILLVIFVAALYALLRFIFLRTGETSALSGFLAFLGIAISTHSFIIGLGIVVAVAVFRAKIEAFLTECGITRDRVETFAKGVIKKRK
jgi:hypothetical protein